MAQINTDRIAGMNIHYLYYSLLYFLDTQQKLGVKTIELWAGAPHFFWTVCLTRIVKKSGMKWKSIRTSDLGRWQSSTWRMD